MCANSSGTMFGWLCGRYPGLIGNLLGPGRGLTVWPFAPYALDNGAYPAFENKTEWDSSRWLKMIDEAHQNPIKPLWAVVPDVVTDKERTLESWHRWLPIVQQAGFTPALAVQDGMVPSDVPASAEVVFVGGSTAWKWQTVEVWAANFPRVHVGRVNGFKKLVRCWEAGVESTDGTGWFRGRHRQLQGLINFCEFVSGRQSMALQRRLFDTSGGQNSVDPVAGAINSVAYRRPPSARGNYQQAEKLIPTLFN